jgi:protoheme IX farnesyltransferase
MGAEPIVASLNRVIPGAPQLGNSRTLRDYVSLTKPEVNFLIVVTTFAGCYLGCKAAGRSFPVLLALNTVIGTLLVASGTGTLNQYLEREFDSQMRRTSRRPLAAGRLSASRVLRFGIALSLTGAFYLVLTVNLLASVLATVTSLSYLFLYTPLKRKTPLCTLMGAFPGAMPPLIGWAGATGGLTTQAWALYAVLFLWQFPHFMAIAWIYREDYARAGYDVLPATEGWRRRLVDLQTLLPLVALLLISLLAGSVAKQTAFVECAEVLLSLLLLYCGWQFVLQKNNSTARRLLTASILYLPFVFGAMKFRNG